MHTEAESDEPLRAAHGEGPVAVEKHPFLSGGGVMGALMRTHDWAATPFGPPDSWPQSLRSMVAFCLNSPVLGTILWGPELRMLYNDAYIPSMAALHPRALGRPVREVWGAAWEQVAAHFEQVLRTGQGFSSENVPIQVMRREAVETTYWSFTASPIRGEDGSIVGLLNQGTETTAQVIAARREVFRRELADALLGVVEPREVMRVAAEMLGRQLQVDRSGYAEIAADDEYFEIESDWTSGTMPSLVGHGRLDDFGPAQIQAFRRGEIVAFVDGLADPITRGEGVEATLTATQTRASLTVPLLRNNRFAAALYVHCRDPRRWTDADRAIAQDVAARTWSAVARARAEADLRRSEARFQQAIQAASAVGTWDWDMRTDRVTADERFARLYSVDPELAAQGAPLSAFVAGVHPEDRARIDAAIRQAIATGGEYRAEYRLLSAAGAVRWALAYGKAYYDASGTPKNFPGVTIDITSAKTAELRRLAVVDFADRIRDLVDPAGIAYIASEIIARTLDVSRAGYGTIDSATETITIEHEWNAPGVEPLPRLLHFRDYGSYIDDLKRGESVVIGDADHDLRSAGMAASLKAISAQAFINMPVTEHAVSVALLYVNHASARDWTDDDLAFVRDIAERTRTAEARVRAEAELRLLNTNLESRVLKRTLELESAQEALRQSQKMEAVGQLTGGIAHDFNNMLAVVSGSLELLARRIATDDVRARRYIEAAGDGARRAAVLTQRLLAFSRQQPLQPEAVDVNKLVAGMAALMKGSLGGSIRIETVLAGGIWRTHVDANQLENALLNLAVNARDAMPDGGKLTLETQNAHLDERYAALHGDVTAGQYVLIAVTDTGCGMSPEIIHRAFDPFFTTKEVGKGTGLGLSQVYGFVKQSGGHIKIYSERGQGTTMKVYLRRLPESAVQAVADETAHDVALSRRHELILVVEDEPAVRQFSVDALSELGYEVIAADGGSAALQLLAKHADIALMFTDIVMPELNGRRLTDAALQLRPDLKVLFTTGYTRNAVVHNGVLDSGVELLGKPFTLEALAAKVREILDRRAAPDTPL
jgi:signal transduction histidine kinase/PAS domain-containing protein/ActR/RegA family two-component response regulator